MERLGAWLISWPSDVALMILWISLASNVLAALVSLFAMCRLKSSFASLTRMLRILFASANFVLVSAGVGLLGSRNSNRSSLTLFSTGCRLSLLNSNQSIGVVVSLVAVALPVLNTVEKKVV